MTTPLPVTVYSDVICPWCYVGKRRLELALEGRDMPEIGTLAWKPFELNPDMPPGGMERASYRARKFGEAKSAALDHTMTETGAEVGIRFAFERMKRTPNTRLAHRLIWEADRQQAQNPLVTRLFQAYFEEARDIGEERVLLEVADEAGLDVAACRTTLADTATDKIVAELEANGYRMGIQGVPFFILAGKYAISGAQPPELWRDALPKIAAEMREA